MRKPNIFSLAALLTICLITLQASAQNADTRIFIYSPGEKAGLHIATDTAGLGFTDLGQLCSSDYGPWGHDKRMIQPHVLRASDGTWRAVWQVNETAPTFAATYSDDLVNWRPQDYPRLREHGVSKTTLSENANGTFTVAYTSHGKVYAVDADAEFRHFSASRAATMPVDALHRDTVDVDGKPMVGQLFSVGADLAAQVVKEFNARKADAELSSETMRDDSRRFSTLTTPVSATLHVYPDNQKSISDRLIGVFFEDISHAADGGLYAELLQNGDFEFTSNDNKAYNSTTAWHSSKPVNIATGQPLSQNNAHYAIIGADTLFNLGWHGIADTGAVYSFSVYARNLNSKKSTIKVALVDSLGNARAEASITVKGDIWAQYNINLNSTRYKNRPAITQLRIVGPRKGTVAIDMASLFPSETYRGHGLRKDLAEAIAALHPRFMRFPGGCMSHGQGIDNIYHWNETVGELKDRRPAPNIWNYHQSRGLGFYEYFQFCEDIGAEPLPVLAAGVPCQNSRADAYGLAGQQGGISMDDMPAYIDEILNMIEWANGDPQTSKWAKLRADADHPAPFGLKMIGIGNEDLISTAFEERYLMICRAIKARYPQIEVCGTVGPFHAPSSDYIEGWRLAKANKPLLDMVDEHYYESTGWFLHHQDYYDHYDRTAPKVYLGEYASRTRTMESALAEAIHLCNIERNADVVSMTSYAPLLCHERYPNWNPDMIYFDNQRITALTPSYYTQLLFGTHQGDRYIASSIQMPPELGYRVAASVVADSKTGQKYLKVVNALPVELRLSLDGISLPESYTSQTMTGQPTDKTTQLTTSTEHGQTITLPPYSVKAVAF